MSPADRAVPIALAELAIEVEAVKGNQRLLESRVDQSLQVLTTLVQNVQAEQERAREDRMKQIALLQSLNDRVASFGKAADKVDGLQDKVNYWRGMFVAFGMLASLIGTGVGFWVRSEFASAASARAVLEQRVQTLEHRP